MKRALLIVALVALACGGVYANELINGSFEEVGATLTGWTLSPGGYPIERATQEPQDGSYVARSIKGWYSGSTADTELYQDVMVAPGVYDVALSGFVKRYVLDNSYGNHADWGWVRVDLTVDGVVVNSIEFGADDAWHGFLLTWSGPVQAYKDVHIWWGLTAAGGGGKSFDVMLADGFVLEETLVPEPASMLVLLGGLGGLILRRRK